MTPLTLQDFRSPYEYVILAEPVSEVRRLLALGCDGVMSTSVTLAEQGQPPRLLDLAGLGREIWLDVDPVEYVRGLRDEWGSR